MSKDTMNILIADDEHLIRKWLMLLIQNARPDLDYSFIEAGNGKEACTILATQRFDLVFTDIKMPFSDGLEVVKFIKKHQPTLTVVVLSAYNELDDVKTAIREGAYDYILKAEMEADDLARVIGVAEQRISFRQSDNVEKGLLEQIQESNLKTRNTAIRDALKLIQKHYSERLTLNSVSQAVFLNRSYFSQLFKKETGYSFADYIERVRLQAACQKLTETNGSIGEIAAAVGFTSQAYFSKQFKKTIGLTPGEYRRQNR